MRNKAAREGAKRITSLHRRARFSSQNRVTTCWALDKGFAKYFFSTEKVFEKIMQILRSVYCLFLKEIAWALCYLLAYRHYWHSHSWRRGTCSHLGMRHRIPHYWRVVHSLRNRRILASQSQKRQACGMDQTAPDWFLLDSPRYRYHHSRRLRFVIACRVDMIFSVLYLCIWLSF